jgi:preprotein translocase subunit YajC
VVSAANSSQGGGSLLPLLLLVGVFALMYFLVIRPQSQRRKNMQSMQSAVEEGAPVMTLGGLYGTVISAGDDTVVLQVSPGITNTYAKQAIAKVLSDEDAIKAGLAPGAHEVVAADEADELATPEIPAAAAESPRVEAPASSTPAASTAPAGATPVTKPVVTEEPAPAVSDPTAPAPLETPEDSTERR